MTDYKSAKDFCALAIEKYQSGNYLEAIEAFNKSLALNKHWQPYQGLGLALFNRQQYQKAIEAFNKSIALHEHWQSCQGLGLALFKTQQYQEAIEAFNKSIALHEHWQSCQGLGLALFKTQQYQEAIEAFNKSIALHEHWQSYQGLGWALFKTQQYQEAIEAFNKSLALNEYWQSYQGLGWALSKTQQYQEAIEAFNKYLALHEDWQSYQELGLALSKTQQYQEAIEAFNKSLSLHEDWQSYQGLEWALNKLGKVEEVTLKAQIYYRSSETNPHKTIDPSLGEKSGVSVTRNLIEDITENLSRIQFAFHPSYHSEVIKDDQLLSWKHLIFIHIPKCAGTNFVEPLSKMMEYIQLKNQGETRHSNAELKHYLWHGELIGKCMHDAYLLEAFQGKTLDDLEGSFLSNHFGKNGIYNQNLKEVGISAKKICLVRDQSKRLYSHIRHHGRNDFDKNVSRDKYIKEFPNLMDRYIYDYNLFEGYEESPYCDPFAYQECESIDFLDIADDQAISKVKSSFLSATLLPNIVQFNRLNDNNSKVNFKGRLGEKDFQDIHKELISRGFLERDNQIDLEFLKKRTKERLVFPEIIHKGEVLHPITFVYPRNGAAKLMLTKDFIANPLDAINC